MSNIIKAAIKISEHHSFKTLKTGQELMRLNVIAPSESELSRLQVTADEYKRAYAYAIKIMGGE